MKKWLSLLFVVSCMLFLSAGIVHAAKAETLVPKLILDGKLLVPNVPPEVMAKSVMVPMRIVTENLGYKVDYDNKKKMVTVSNGIKQLVMTLDQSTAYLDNEPKQMITPPTSKSNNLLIPLRFLGDSLDVQVFWDNINKSVFLYSTEGTDPDKGTDLTPPDDGLIGSVDGPDNTDGGGTLPDTDPTITPPIAVPAINGNIHEVRYEANTIIIKYDGLIVPNAFKLDNPKRIVIDLPNSQYAVDLLPAVDFTKLNEGKLLVTDHPALQSIRYSLFGELTKAPRIVLDLNQVWDYEFVTDPFLGELRINLKQPTANKSLYTVVLDAGHGGRDPGTTSLSKKSEKSFNLAVTLKVQALLAGDERINLVLTRSGDTYPSLSERYQLANSLKADLFVSIHANSNDNAAINGTETYYSRDDNKGLADLMHSLLVPATGLKDGGVRKKNLAVTRETTMPAVLLESGYLSNKNDEPQMWTTEFQDRVALAIATGIKQFLKLV